VTPWEGGHTAGVLGGEGHDLVDQGINQIFGRVGTRAGRRDINLVLLPRIELRFVGSRNQRLVAVTAVGICASGRYARI